MRKIAKNITGTKHIARYLCSNVDWENRRVMNPLTGRFVKVKSLPPEEKEKY